MQTNDDKTHIAHKAMILSFLLIGLLSPAVPAKEKQASEPNDPNRYLNAVREFADNVLKYGRDTYGPKHTPLFVDGLMVRDPNNPDYGKDGVFKPVEWIAPNGDRWILSNLASQQNLFRTLDGLTMITRDPKYKQAAMDAIRYAFDNLRSPNGLLYWGHMAAYDASSDKLIGSLHDLKLHYPYYKLMWEVDSNSTKRLIEAFWSAHILDWSNLDMNRMAQTSMHLGEAWSHEYKGGPTPFKGNGLAGFHTASSLIHAATVYQRQSGNEFPVVWSKRLLHRYIDAGHPNTGISAFIYNQSWGKLDGDLKEHFNDPRTTLFPFNPFEARFLYWPENTVAQPWIGLFLVGDMLGGEGSEFSQLALKELTAWGKVSYRREDNSFIPMLTDGVSIEGYVCKENYAIARKGDVIKPYFVDSTFFWAYTVAYRITSDEFMWQMVRDIAFGNKFGDVGETLSFPKKLRTDGNCSDVYGLLGFLELYRKTKRPEFLDMAKYIGNNILDNQFYRGFFVPSKRHIYTRFDCFEPLVLLQLDAATKSMVRSMPTVWPSSPLFVLPYRYKEQGVDRRTIYGLTESSEPPLSLQEAASIGNIDLARTLIEEGVEVDGIEDGFKKTALHYAAIKGRKDLVELLIAEGADIDARDSFGNSALHYAAEKGNKEIVELLIVADADVDAVNFYGDTPLQYAAYADNREIIEILLQKGATIANLHVASYIGDLDKAKAFINEGADINATDGHGYASLHYAAKNNQKQAAELLIDKGADVDIENWQGQTPLDIAFSRGYKDIVELLVAKGAHVSSIFMAASIGDLTGVKVFIEKGIDINMKEKGMSALHYAAKEGHKEVVELLLENGARVNEGMNLNKTAAELAMEGGHNDIVELLTTKGADRDIVKCCG